ncbi:MAG: hypothetical protein H0V30_04815 [Chitinophagaceae bacterium]|jgi:hypothetical protein|nr:hypothetical protein [Chitinophagaceae bacterium]
MNAKDLLHLSLDYDLRSRCKYFTTMELKEQWENIEWLLINLQLTPADAIVQRKDGSGNPIKESSMPNFHYFFKGLFLDEKGSKFYNQELFDEIVNTVKLVKPIPLEKSDFHYYKVINILYRQLFKYRVSVHPFTVQKDLILYGFTFGSVYNVHL